ncbi:MAG: alanine racemase, partial [Actinomycetia bacterium]|nr:alanine racemase [Actinomycetes bacterium]
MTAAEIDLSAIRRNIEALAEHSDTAVCAVLKADAYGHGVIPVARTALDAGATWLAVATVGEAVDLGEAVGNDTPILVLSERPGPELDAFRDRLPRGLRLTICSTAGLVAAR